jgi:hypothetical protein
VNKVSIAEQKRAYLRQAAALLKKRDKLLKKDIAKRMGETENAFSRRISEKTPGPVPDEYIDRFVAEFGIPFSAGDQPVGEAVTAEAMVKLLVEVTLMKTAMVQMMQDVKKLTGQE